MNEKSSWKFRTLVIGTIIGALSGLVAGYIIIQRAETAKTQPKVTAGDGVRVGLGVLGVLRQLADLGVPK